MIRNERGQALVEFVLVIPLLLLLLVGIVDIGRMAYTYSSLHFTAQETVRIGGFGHGDAEIAEFARDNFKLGDPSELQVMVTPEPAVRKSGDYITVILKYPINPITPFASQIFSGPIMLKTDSTIRIE